MKNILDFVRCAQLIPYETGQPPGYRSMYVNSQKKSGLLTVPPNLAILVSEKSSNPLKSIR